MATSLVHAVGLPELSVTTLEDYRALAIALGNDRQRLQALKQRLAAQRMQASVFRTKDQARRLENAFEQALQRFHKGLPPADIQVT
jgi:predicted O-linked N-acetylglucosamine transferase (SPINDLY family)